MSGAHRTAEAGIEPVRRRPTDLLDRELVRDGRLSFRALGVAVRLLSNAPGYRMDSLALAAEGTGREGRDAIRTALSELEKAGYLSRERIRLPGGQWVTRAVIADRQLPRASPAPENPASAPTPENPAPGKPTIGGIGDKSRLPKRHHSRSITTTTVDTLVWPTMIAPAERAVVVQRYLGGLDASIAQDVLDELAGCQTGGKSPAKPLGWLRACIARAQRGEFVLDAGLSVKAARQKRAADAAVAHRRQADNAAAEARRNDPAARTRTEAARLAAVAEIERLGLRPKSIPSEEPTNA